MLKIIVTIVAVVALLGGGVYAVLQPRSLPTPILVANPQGVAQSTLNDVRIRDSRWLSPDGNWVWVVCRFGQPDRVRSSLLVDLEEKNTRANLRGASLVCWIGDHEVLVYNQGRTDSRLQEWMKVFHPDAPIARVTQFFALDVNSGESRKICEVTSTKNLNTIQVSPDGLRAVGCWGPEELYEFEIRSGSPPRKTDEPYAWAPVWIDSDNYLLIGDRAINSRTFGAEGSKTLSQVLLPEVRDAISKYGSPSVRICGKHGENILLHDHSPEKSHDRLLVLDLTASPALVEEVARMIPSSDLPRFDPDGGMMVYQGQQFDRNMDNVYLQTVEVDSEPVELVTGEFGNVQESTPLFRRGDAILYVHRGIELRSLSLADGETELHWPIAIVPN